MAITLKCGPLDTLEPDKGDVNSCCAYMVYAGTVLYIVMHLLSADNGADDKVGVLELFLLLCGLSIMAAVSLYS